MNQISNKTDEDFVQRPEYAVNFGIYKKLLTRVLNHDPKMFELEKGALIVDVGCGYGDLLKVLKSRGYEKLVGVEPDALCREDCVKQGLDVRLGTLNKTELPDAFADVVIVNQVFHHIDNYDSAADELARILKPNGLLCFLEPSPTFLRRTMDVLTFKTPLPRLLKPVKTRYEVMKLEMETGLYPSFLNHQSQFHSAINSRFSRIWLRHGWFFQFGKYTKKT